MKTTKRIFAVLFAGLLLGFLCVLPAGADEAVEATAPSISKQPAAITLMFAGDDLVLEAGATAMGTLTYTWYREGSAEPVGTGAKLVLPTHASLLTNVFTFQRYYAVVTCTTYVDGGPDVTETATTRYATVVFLARLGDAMYGIWGGSKLRAVLASPLLAIATIGYVFTYPLLLLSTIF